MSGFIHTPTPELARSKAYFTQLGFSPLSINDLTHFTDGKCIIEVNTDRFARPGVKLYRKSWQSQVEKLSTQTILPIEGGYVLKDPDGVMVYLMEDSVEVPSLADYPPSVLGNLAGVGIESLNLSASLKFWEVLGFELQMGATDKGWIAMVNEEGMGISCLKTLNCPHLFFNPSLTFFNGQNNVDIIEAIRKKNIPIVEEITAFNSEGIVDNVILQEPGGYGFFVFSD